MSASLYLHSHAPADSAYSPEQIRQLVLEYLSSSCYPDTARAFAEEWTALGELPAAGASPGTAGPPLALAGAGPSSNGSGSATCTNAHNLRSSSARAAEPGKRYARAGVDEGMDGVEQTPPPSERVEITITATSPAATRTTNGNGNGNGNGKAVAFEAGNGYEEDSGSDDEDDEGVEMGVLSRGELSQIRLRRSECEPRVVSILARADSMTSRRFPDVRNHILYGRIQQAVDLLESRFPSVLAPPATAAPPAPRLTLSNGHNAPPPVLPSPADDSCDPHALYFPPPPSHPPASASLFAPSGGSPLPVVGESFAPECISLEPTILALDLQLQVFIEAMRAAYNSSSAPSTPASSGILPPSSNGSDAGMSMSGSAGSLNGALPSAMSAAIAQSQRLNQMVRRLEEGARKEKWRTIAIDVSGLLAYKELRDAPVRGYMAQGRRETLAELVNAAILRESPFPGCWRVEREGPRWG